MLFILAQQEIMTQETAGIVLQAALALLAITASIALLFKTMGDSYGRIIEALRKQNDDQQKRIEALERKTSDKSAS